MNIREIIVTASAKLAAVIALTTLLGTQAQAAIITLAATDSGWYSHAGAHSSNNQNYIAGTTNGQDVFRNFFVFDLSGVTETIVGATFRAYNPSDAVTRDTDDGYISANATETYGMFEVSTAIASLTGGSGGVAAFNDFAMGLSYGSREFGTVDNGSIVSLALNAAALVNLNGSSGQFALGGAVTSLTLGQGRQHVFGFTGGPTGGSAVSNQTRELILTTRSAVPAPSALALVGLGLMGLGLWRRRQDTDTP